MDPGGRDSDLFSSDVAHRGRYRQALCPSIRALSHQLAYPWANLEGPKDAATRRLRAGPSRSCHIRGDEPMTGTHLPALTPGKGRALSASVLTTTEGGDCGVRWGEDRG